MTPGEPASERTPLESRLAADRERQREALRKGPIPEADFAALADAADKARGTLERWGAGERPLLAAAEAASKLRAARGVIEARGADDGAVETAGVYRAAAWAARARGMIGRLGGRAGWRGCVAAALGGDRAAELVARLGLTLLPAGVRAEPDGIDPEVCSIDLDGWPIAAVCSPAETAPAIADAAARAHETLRGRRATGLAVAGVDAVLSADPAQRFADDATGISRTTARLDELLLEQREAALRAGGATHLFGLVVSAERMLVNASARRIGIVAAVRAINLSEADDPRTEKLARLLERLDRTPA